MGKIRIQFFSVFCILVLIFGCGKLPDERLMDKAKKLEQQEKFSEAINSYEKLVEQYPTSPLAAEALYRAGLVYTNGLQDFDNAISSLQRVIEKYPDSQLAAQCQFMIGFIYANNTSDTLQARLAYSKFLENYPEHELVPSVEWELKYLGKDINEIPELQNLDQVSQGEKK